MLLSTLVVVVVVVVVLVVNFGGTGTTTTTTSPKNLLLLPVPKLPNFGSGTKIQYQNLKIDDFMESNDEEIGSVM